MAQTQLREFFCFVGNLFSELLSRTQLVFENFSIKSFLSNSPVGFWEESKRTWVFNAEVGQWDLKTFQE